MKQQVLPTINARYSDVNEPRPRYGAGFFTLHRQVRDIQDVPAGKIGTIRYNGQCIRVYLPARRIASCWSTDPEVMGPIKITYLH